MKSYKVIPYFLICIGTAIISIGAYQATATTLSCSIPMLVTDWCNNQHVSPAGLPTCLGHRDMENCVGVASTCRRCDGAFRSATNICINWPSPSAGGCETSGSTEKCGNMFQKYCNWDYYPGTADCFCPESGGVLVGDCEFQIASGS